VVDVELRETQFADVEQVGGVVDHVVRRGGPAVPRPAGPVVGGRGGGVVLIEVGQDDRAAAALTVGIDVLVDVVGRGDQAVAVGIDEQVGKRRSGGEQRARFE